MATPRPTRTPGTRHAQATRTPGTRRLRVVNVLEEGVFGGPQRRSVRVASELVNREGELGADTTLLIPKGSAELIAACRETTTPFHEISMSALSRKPARAAEYVASYPFRAVAMARLLRQLRPDVVHVSGGSFCLVGPTAARLARIPYVWHLNDTSAEPIVMQAFKRVSSLARPHHLIYAGHAVKDYYADVVPAGVDATFVPAPYGDLTPQPDAPRDPAAPIGILLIANVNKIKGINIAIDAMIQLVERGHDVHLSIAGAIKETQNEHHRELLEQSETIRDRITFLGHCSDLAPLLAAADISLCSSHAEASPMAVWEAASVGQPLVSTDVGDVARELPNEVGALIVAPREPAPMADALERMILDPALRERLGIEAQLRVQQRMSVAAVASAHLEAYEATLEA